MQRPFLLSLWDFVRKPRWDTESPSISWSHFAQALAWGIVGSLVIGIVIQIIVSLFNIELSNSVVTLVEESTWYEMLFFAAIVAPIVEEFVFRLPLSSVRWVWIIWLIGFVAWTYYFFGLSGIPLTVFSIVAGMMIGIISFKESSHWRKTLAPIQSVWIVCSIVLFGVIHLLNYENLPLLYGGILIFIMPQIWGGLLMAYLRVRQSFLIAVLYHCLYNFLLAAPVVLLYPIIDQPDLENLSSADELLVHILGIGFVIGSALLVSVVVWSMYQVVKFEKVKE